MTKVKLVYALISVSLICSSVQIYGQNLLRNQGFEQKSPFASSSLPDGISQLHSKCQYWRSFGNSSDWLSTSSFDGCFDSGCGTIGSCVLQISLPMTTHNGGLNEHYAGFGFCEGIQQKLVNTTEKDFIRVDFYWSPRDCKVNTNIRVYLLKDNAAFNEAPNDCSNPSLGANNLSFATVPVNVTGANPEHIPGSWYHFVSDWIAVGDYDWFFVKGENKIGANNNGTITDESYIFIDDVTVLNRDVIVEPACCPQSMLYEFATPVKFPLIPETRVEDFIKVGFDAGIPEIEGDVVVGSSQNVQFVAGNFIELLPGFSTELGAEFKAEIGDCSPSFEPDPIIFLGLSANLISPDGTIAGAPALLHGSATNATSYDIDIYRQNSDIELLYSTEDIAINANPFVLWDGSGACLNHVGQVYLRLYNCDHEAEWGNNVTPTTRTVTVTFAAGCKTAQESEDTTANPIFGDTLVELALDVRENNQRVQPSYRVVPNPNNGNFNIEIDLNEKEKYNIKICDLLGKVVYQVKGVESEIFVIDISQNPEGIYLVSLWSEDQMYFRKIILH
ncbi:MAG: T9SS type A sorting domain-containing protein [Flavobacteriales bacterium]|nr:T9SS type A sorting domain-containing protein [Flavobacteriales bacterium]